MKKLFILFLLPFAAQAFEYEKQLENDKVIVSKWKMAPGEELGLHRDAYPRVVISLQGGVITRIETDGKINEVSFPKGTPVYLEADPEGQLHKGANRTKDTIEAIMVQFKN